MQVASEQYQLRPHKPTLHEQCPRLHRVSHELGLGLQSLDAVDECEGVLFFIKVFGIDLYETDELDVKPVHDVIVPLLRLGTKDVRLILH